MAIDFQNSIDSLSELDLWIKVKNAEDLTLADVPELIRLRWSYFRDNWPFIKEKYTSEISNYEDPDKLKLEIEDFDLFVISQRSSKNNKNPFDDNNIIYRFYAIFNNTYISSIATTLEEELIVNNRVNYIKSFTRKDFLEIRKDLEAERDAMADRVNLSDEDYNRVFDRSSQTARVNAKNKNINNMYELMASIKTINYILANYFSLQTAIIDPFALAKSNAANPEIDIATYSSGSLVKLNYGEDLQSLAKRTMNNPNKWIDIAIANGLKAPYIDEIGQKIMLMSNGSENQINISGIQAGTAIIDKLYVGQSILLQSTVQTFPEQRKILNLRQIPISGDILIELEGSRDLDKYRIAEGAHIRIYKPNTANSSVYVLIPSKEKINDSTSSEVPWFLKSSDSIERRQKVDLSLDDKGDLNFNSNSDLQLTYGLDNSMQAIKLKLAVEAGELRRHPAYGLNNVVGDNNLNNDRLKSILTESILRNISSDGRFAGLERLDVTYLTQIDSNSLTAFSITLVVRIAGSDQLVPISFTVNV